MDGRQVLVVNSGSSSLKCARVEARSGRVLDRALAERLGSDAARIIWNDDRGERRVDAPGLDHTEALERVLAHLDTRALVAVGHRVVHGGERFVASTLVDDSVIAAISEMQSLAPLHNPANLLGIRAALRAFPELPQAAVFDTAFHQTLPPEAYLYALPFELYERHRLRRYGFHGTSHRYVASEAARRLERPLGTLQLVTAHLGNGCSAAAVRHGRSVDTTMGLSPLEGLVMGTRSGDVDPYVFGFLKEHTGASLEETLTLLNHDSGLLGLSGVSNDMRRLLELEAEGHERARLAIAVFCHRLAKGLLACCASLDRVDAIVFTAGIGENAARVRELTLARLSLLGVELDAEANRAHGTHTNGRITRVGSRVAALVVPTHEEQIIARETLLLLEPDGSL